MLVFSGVLKKKYQRGSSLKVINLFGAPGAGKSTIAAGLFFLMKTKNIQAELVTEFAKDVVWEGHFTLLDDQLYVFAEQNRRLNRLRKKVDYVITDCSLLNSAIYKPAEYPKSFDDIVLDIYNTYENINVFIDRVAPYSQTGRIQMEKESDELAPRIINFLDSRGIDCMRTSGSTDAPDKIFGELILPML